MQNSLSRSLNKMEHRQMSRANLLLIHLCRVMSFLLKDKSNKKGKNILKMVDYQLNF